MSYIKTVHDKAMNQFVKQMDGLIMQKMIDAGIDITNIDYLKEHITRVRIDGDLYDHYYFDYNLPNQKRILSIQRNPEINGPEFMIDRNKFEITAKYY